MKFHALAVLPLGLLLSSCFSDPYPPQRPYRGGPDNRYPAYGPAGYQGSRPQPYDGYQQQESGSYQEVPPPTNQAPPVRQDPSRAPIPDNYDIDPAPTPRKSSGKNYPTARPTDKQGMVESPYHPGKLIDVSELRSGQTAKDPETGEIFRVP